MVETLTLSRNRNHPYAVPVILGMVALLCAHGGMAAVQQAVAATAPESKEPGQGGQTLLFVNSMPGGSDLVIC